VTHAGSSCIGRSSKRGDAAPRQGSSRACRRRGSGSAGAGRRAASTVSRAARAAGVIAGTARAAPQDGCCLLGRELDGLHRDAATVIGNDRLASRPKVDRPASHAVRRLDESAAVELEHADRDRARRARPPTEHRQENVRGTGRHPSRNQPPCERVDQAEEPRGHPLAEVGPGTRAGAGGSRGIS